MRSFCAVHLVNNWVYGLWKSRVLLPIVWLIAGRRRASADKTNVNEVNNT
nr:MAG TPA: hypothetical protein [Caudoviricetes sp.]DAN47670.1 MAG TPA: hypothetical protein [Caudoviricetes sp.]DAU56170.1 MAG TPA: hypothetical protein [Caudoviricetes sp.]